MMVEYFPGIKTEQPHRMTEKRYLDSPETIIIHVGTNNLRTTRNLDCVMEEVGGYGKEETPELQTCPEWSVATYICVMEAYWVS